MIIPGVKDKDLLLGTAALGIAYYFTSFSLSSYVGNVARAGIDANYKNIKSAVADAATQSFTFGSNIIQKAISGFTTYGGIGGIGAGLLLPALPPENKNQSSGFTGAVCTQQNPYGDLVFGLPPNTVL